MFGRKKEEYQAPVVEEPVQDIPEPQPQPEPMPSTVIGKGVVVVGNFDSKEPIEVLGTIRGNIRSTSSVTISKNGSLIGEAALDQLCHRVAHPGGGQPEVAVQHVPQVV